LKTIETINFKFQTTESPDVLLFERYVL